MALEHWIREQEAAGNRRAVKKGKALLAKFGDEPLPDNKAVLVPDSGEQPVLVRNFAPGTLRDLIRNRAVIFDPLETSLAQLVAANRPFWYLIDRENRDFMSLSSRPTQIAIFPDPEQFYVPESNNLSLNRQRELLKIDLAEVVKTKMGIGGVEEVIDNVATHAGLVFAYLDKTNGRVGLHGDGYGYRCVRTETPTIGSSVALVGYFRTAFGLLVSDWHRDKGNESLRALRLLVPAQE